QLDNIRPAYSELLDRVQVALHTQVGDAPRLREVPRDALSLRASANQHIALIPPEEFETLQGSVARIVADLDVACHQSIDPPETAPLPVIQTVRTGRRGRPSKLIDRNFLQYALEMRGPARIARLLDCCPRTVRRAAIRYGLVQPAPPVFRHLTQADGSVVRDHTTVTAPISTLSDAQLDAEVRNILSVFPDFGRVMIAGHLAAHGHRVPDSRIRFTTVIHGFVDGHSCFVTAIKVNSNNRAYTVLGLFLDGTRRHGVPSRV
ncbi:hypothetical protein C8Q76DRAFT_591606, partial [Earliella scabrosa]